MTRAELLARISSYELTAWMALFNVKGEEDDERTRGLAPAGDDDEEVDPEELAEEAAAADAEDALIRQELLAAGIDPDTMKPLARRDDDG